MDVMTSEVAALEQSKIEQVYKQQGDIRDIFKKFPIAKTRFNKRTTSKGAEILPNVWTDSRRTHLYLEKLAERLNQLDEVAIDDHGLASANGLVSDFNRLRNLTGFGMQPLTIPTLDNTKLREDYGLASSFVSPRHETIFNELVESMFGAARPASLVIRKSASSTFPEFSTEMEVKRAHLLSSLQNSRDIANLTSRGDFKRLLHKYNVVYAYYVLTRSQPDSVFIKDGQWQSKPREVASLDYAWSSGEIGERYIADKRCFDRSGNLIDGFFAMRRRTVWGLSGSVNYLLAAVFSQFREHYLNEFAFTWKHRAADDIRGKLQRFSYYYAADVKQHDQFVADWLVQHWFTRLEDKIRDDVLTIAKTAYGAPYYQPAIFDNSDYGLWSGSPLDVTSFGNKYGLPSGIAYNPDIGKLGMTFIYLTMLDECYHDVLEAGIDSILRGKHSYAILDASDDVVIACSDSRFVDLMLKKQSSGESASPYMVIEPEKGAAFLGNLLVRTSTGELDVVPNIVSAVVNFLAPERGINAALRGNWAVGWFERQNYYAAAPLFEEVYQVIADVSKRHLGMTITDMARNLKQHSNFDVTSLYTAADRSFLLNPDSIYYKISINDLSPFLRNLELSVVEYDDMRKYLTDLILV